MTTPASDSPEPRKPEASRQPRELSTLAWIGYQLETGQIERFPPRFPDDGDDGDHADGAKIGGS